MTSIDKKAFCLLVFSILLIAKDSAINCEDEKDFKVKKHRSSYQSYFTLQNPSTRNQNSGRPPRYGVWYPASSSSNSYPQSFSNTFYTHNPSSSGNNNAGTQGNNNNVDFPGNNDRNQYKLPQLLYQIRNNRLYNLIQQADLFTTLDGDRRFTIFAPTDEAIQNFLENQSKDLRQALLTNKEALSSFLLNHVVPGSILSTDLVNGMKLNNVAGNPSHVIETNEGLTIEGSNLMTRYCSKYELIV